MILERNRALAIAAGALLLDLATLTHAFADDGEARDARVRIGFEIAKRQGIELDRDVPSQGLGSFLVTVSNCNDCHTQPNFTADGNPYVRQTKQVNLPTYLAGGRSFVTPTGTFCSRNLTPEPATHKPAGLTRDQFIYVIRTGCDPQDDNFNDPKTCSLLQVMPWPNFLSYRRSELSAIYDYLSALPHRDPDPNSLQCTPAPQGVAEGQ
ncbi:MAG TPA: hypothetical protein VFL55_22150 [Acetobacteraceae bacterium]|nr:hypothetical protein [Acetobacteraceae bacterium]